MSKSPDEAYENWLLRIRKDLRQAVDAEASENRRTAPAQVEVILCERYDIPILTEEDKRKAREQVASKRVKPVTPRTRKSSSKKTANGTNG